MFFPKLLTLFAVLAASLSTVWFQHRSVTRQRESNLRLQHAIASIEGEISALEKNRLETRQISAGGDVSVRLRTSEKAKPSSSDSSGVSGSQETTPYVTLSKANLKQLELNPLTDDFQLSDEVCAVLGISAAERGAINQAITNLVTTQQQIDVSRIQPVKDHLTTDEGHKTSFKVPSYVEDGKKLASELIAQLQSAVGPERSDLLLGYADLNSLSAVGYEPFGRTEKTITFLDRENPDGSRGDCKIFMKVVDKVTGMALSTSFANTDDSIPQPWRHLIQNVAPAP